MVAPYSGAILPIVARSVRDMRVQSGAVELDELVDDALLAQHLGDSQHQVGGRNALAKPAVQLEADHVRQEHIHRLAEHHGFRLDAADAPAYHAEPVDHGGVRVCSHEGIGQSE